MAFRAEMASVVLLPVYVGRADVNLFRCASILSADSSRWHLGKEGIRSCGFDEA